MPDRPASQPDPRLIRLLADGELDAAQQASFEARVSADESLARAARVHVEWERRLQQAVARTMDPVRAPADLRARVEQVLANDLVEPAAPVRIMNSRAGGARRDRQAWLWQIFASPQRANVVAIAAVLAMVAGAVLFGIFGRTIDDVPAGGGRQPLDLVANAAEYVDGEHGLCTVSAEGLQRKITYATSQQAEVELSRWLGERVRVFDLSALGYEFLGASKCDVPLDQQPSGHLLYRKPDGGANSGPMVSVFMAPARGGCSSIGEGLRRSEWVQATGKPCQHRVMYSTDGHMVYFLVCCNDADVDEVANTLSVAQSAGLR